MDAETWPNPHIYCVEDAERIAARLRLSAGRNGICYQYQYQYRRRPFVIISVFGGVVQVDIVDFDDLQAFRHSDGTVIADFRPDVLSPQAQAWLKKTDPDLWQALYGKPGADGSQKTPTR